MVGTQSQAQSWVDSLDISVMSNVAELRESWLSMGPQAQDPFSCYPWCEAWYQANRQAGKGEPRVVVARSADGVEMILPLFLERKFGLSVLTRPGRSISGDFAAIFSPRLREMAQGDVGDTFWNRVFAATRKEASVLLLNGVPATEIEGNSPLGRLERVHCGVEAFYLTLKPDWDAQYQELFSSKMRRNDRRCLRRLGEEGEMEFLVAEGVEQQKALMEELMDQKAAQIDATHQPHYFHDPVVRDFFLRLPALMEQSEQEVFFLMALKFDGRTIAANFGVTKAQRHFGLITTMSMGEERKFSPGRLLLLETNRVLSERGCNHHEFGNGEYEYKNDWCSGHQERYAVVNSSTLLGAVPARMIRGMLSLRNSIKDSDSGKQFLAKVDKFRARNKL